MQGMPVSTRGESPSGTAGAPQDSAPALITPSLLRDWPLPAAGADKYSRGAVLVIGGARRTPGAALLAGTAALRAGAGRLTLAVAESVAVPLAVTLPESGVIGLRESAGGSLGSAGLEALFEDFDSADAVLIGPGLDDIDGTEALLRELLRHETGRAAASKADDAKADTGADTDAAEPGAIILDAYALGCLPKLLGELGPWAGRLILTPNPAEAAILLERDTDLGDDDGLAAAVVELADKYQAVVSCQGLIARTPGTRRHRRTGRVLGNPSPRRGRGQARQPVGEPGVPGEGTRRRAAVPDDGTEHVAGLLILLSAPCWPEWRGGRPLPSAPRHPDPLLQQ